MEWLIPILICMIVGIVLLVVEVFMPGFGIPGIAGSLLLLASIVMAWMEYGAKVGLGMTVAVLALMGIVVSVSLRAADKGKLTRSDLFMPEEESVSAKAEREDMRALIGQEGKALTALRPVGAAEFACGRLSVQADNEYIEKDTPVRIMRTEGTTIFVKRV